MNYPLAVGIFAMCLAQLSFATYSTTAVYEEDDSTRCPAILCPLVCTFGLERDANNCSICKCINPCQRTECPDGTKCQFDERQCVGRSFCSPVPHCVAINETVEPRNGTSDNGSTGYICPLYKCQTPCRSGYGIDMRGCLDGCRCNNPCENVECPDGKMCQPLSYNGATCVDACCPPALFPAANHHNIKCDRQACAIPCQKGTKCCSADFGCKRCMYPIPCNRRLY